MQLSHTHFGRGSAGKRGLYRLLYWLVLIIVTLQLIGAGHHHHSLTDQSRDCVSCYITAHFPPPIPSVGAVVLPSPAVLNYQIAPLPIYLFVAQQSYLIPHSQAPPRAFSFDY
jgi:hypothetical protein